MTQKDFQDKIEKKFCEIDLSLKDIDKKLGNHIVHIAGDISSIRTDIDWLKKIGNCFTDKKENGEAETKSDIKAANDIAWLKKLTWLIISTAIVALSSLIISIIMFLLNK